MIISNIVDHFGLMVCSHCMELDEDRVGNRTIIKGISGALSQISVSIS